MNRSFSLLTAVLLVTLSISPDVTAQKILVVTGETLEVITNTTSIEHLSNRFSNARSVVVEFNAESMNADHRGYDLVIKDGYAGEYDWCLGEKFSFTPFEKTYVLKNQDLKATEEQWDWKGSVEDEPQGYAQFTIHHASGGVTGTIATPSTELTVRPIAGTNKHLVTEVDRSARVGLTSWSRRFERSANKLVKKYGKTRLTREERLLNSKLVSEHRREVFAALHGDYFLVENPEWGGVSGIAMPDGSSFLQLSSFDPKDVIRDIRDTVGPAFGWTGKEKFSLASRYDGSANYRYVFRQTTKGGVPLEHVVVVSADKSTGGVHALLGDDIVPSWKIGLSRTKAPSDTDKLQLERKVTTYFSEKFRSSAIQAIAYSMAESPTLTAKYDRNWKQLRWKWLCIVQPSTSQSSDSSSGRMIVVDTESGEVVSDLPLAPSMINIESSNGFPHSNQSNVSQITNHFNSVRLTDDCVGRSRTADRAQRAC